jgi:hypothetical protein
VDFNCNIISEYFVITKKALPGGGLSTGDTCYSLRTKTNQSLQIRDSQVSPEDDQIFAILTNLREILICTNKNSCKKATICVSGVGCFCWKGWKGRHCGESNAKLRNSSHP